MSDIVFMKRGTFVAVTCSVHDVFGKALIHEIPDETIRELISQNAAILINAGPLQQYYFRNIEILENELRYRQIEKQIEASDKAAAMSDIKSQQAIKVATITMWVTIFVGLGQIAATVWSSLVK